MLTLLVLWLTVQLDRAGAKILSGSDAMWVTFAHNPPPTNNIRSHHHVEPPLPTAPPHTQTIFTPHHHVAFQGFAEHPGSLRYHGRSLSSSMCGLGELPSACMLGRAPCSPDPSLQNREGEPQPGKDPPWRLPCPPGPFLLPSLSTR